MKRNYKVMTRCGIGYVTHSHVYAESEQDAMDAMWRFQKEWPDYWEHAGGLIEVLWAVPYPP